MSKVIIVAGDYGTGKSRSIKTLPPEETVIIRILDKELPWKGSEAKYNAKSKNVIDLDDAASIMAVLDALFKKIESKERNVKYLIIDDALYLMTTELFNRATETGYSKFTEIGKHMQELIRKCSKCPLPINIAIMFHIEDEESDKRKVAKKIKTIGQMLDDKYNPHGTVTTCLFTDVSFGEDGKAKYEFITNRTMVGGIIIPAKSPEGMFDLKIPNDLKMVFDQMDSYYKSE